MTPPGRPVALAPLILSSRGPFPGGRPAIGRRLLPETRRPERSILMKKASSRPRARPVTAKTAGPLNAAQQRAVRHGRAPLLIIAGAGTGKTLTLAHRVAS